MRAMAVDMIGRQVGQDADIRRQARRQIDLEAGHFQHIDGLGRWRRPVPAPTCRYCRRSGRRSRRRSGYGPTSAVVVDLPLVPVMAMTGALPGLSAIGADFAGEQFDIADHRHLGAHWHVRTTPCGLGWVSGTPGDSTSAAIFSHGHSRQGIDLGAFLAAQIARGAVVVPGDHLRAAGHQRTHRAQPGAGQAENGDGLVGKGAGWRSSRHRSFRVARPSSASTTATIQKRITMVGSVQPSCS